MIHSNVLQGMPLTMRNYFIAGNGERIVYNGRNDGW